MKDESGLLALLKEKDMEAFSTLYDTYAASLYGIIKDNKDGDKRGVFQIVAPSLVPPRHCEARSNPLHHRGFVSSWGLLHQAAQSSQLRIIATFWNTPDKSADQMLYDVFINFKENLKSTELIEEGLFIALYRIIAKMIADLPKPASESEHD